MDAMIFSFQEEKKRRTRAVFEWAVNEQARMGLTAEPIRLTAKQDNMTGDPLGCIISIFYDEESGKALLRRDWLNDMGVKYNLLTNFDEIRRIAPKSVQHMMENATRIYEYYDGPYGGITRDVDYAWAY